MGRNSARQKRLCLYNNNRWITDDNNNNDDDDHVDDDDEYNFLILRINLEKEGL